jgi:aryl-alcohol dehydrogenase-like predicted oxidoreductase
MEYRQLGRSGLWLSELGLGTMSFGQTGDGETRLGSTDIARAQRQLDLCLDHGVNLVDTADVYADGRSEEIVGRIVRGRRERLIVATKARFATGPNQHDAGLSRQHLIAACEASLRRLGIDHIDLYQMHQWDGRTPVEETLGALDDLVRAGKVRYIGCSNFSAWHVGKSLAASERRGYASYVSQQIHYSLVSRDAESELVPLSLDAGLGILVWSPLAGGLLSGKYRRDRARVPGTRYAAGWNEPPIHDWDHAWAIIDALVEIAAECDASPAQVALRFTLDMHGVTTSIIGARTEEQLVDNLGAAAVRLEPSQRDRLEQISRPPLRYPYWHQATNETEWLGPADLAFLEPYIERG